MILDWLLFTDSWATLLKFDTIQNMANIVNYDAIHWVDVAANIQNLVDISYNIYIIFFLVCLIWLIKTFYKFILWLLPFKF